MSGATQKRDYYLPSDISLIVRWVRDIGTALNYHLNEKLDRIERKVDNLMANLADLTAKVAELTTVEQSAIALINGLAQQLKDAVGDPAAIQGVIDSLEAGKQALANAVAANTTPVVEPPA